MREQNARLERRVEELEAQLSVAEGLSRSGASASSTAVPPLTVVKLKPKGNAPPKLDTHVRVSEPSAEATQLLASEEPVRSARAVPEEDPDISELRYNQAVSALRTGNLAGGVSRLEEFADAHPRHSHADNAIYFAGVGLMGMEDFEAAAQRFERVLKEYPAGDAVADAALKLAECRMRMNKPLEAKSLYSQVVKDYPGTAAAEQASERLGALKP